MIGTIGMAEPLGLAALVVLMVSAASWLSVTRRRAATAVVLADAAVEAGALLGEPFGPDVVPLPAWIVSPRRRSSAPLALDLPAWSPMPVAPVEDGALAPEGTERAATWLVAATGRTPREASRPTAGRGARPRGGAAVRPFDAGPAP